MTRPRRANRVRQDRLFDDLPSAPGQSRRPIPDGHIRGRPVPDGPPPDDPVPEYGMARGRATPDGRNSVAFPPAPYAGSHPYTGPNPLIGGHLVPHRGYDPEAPYGRDPVSGFPYSDRSKVVAGLLQLFLPIGIGRLYAGHTGIGIAQLLLTVFFGLGQIWAFIDGIVILAGRPTDGKGRPLRP